MLLAMDAGLTVCHVTQCTGEGNHNTLPFNWSDMGVWISGLQQGNCLHFWSDVDITEWFTGNTSSVHCQCLFMHVYRVWLFSSFMYFVVTE